ncbi:MAG: lysophospholipid acyltransferase family protein [Cyanobacteriota bacterium]|nr:lysophospholipid acyltransferase family protein [Cyanobacteriota bacterium]
MIDLLPAQPLPLAQLLLSLCQTQVWVEGRERLPRGAALIISNHRSFLDAPVLLAGLNRPVRLACHYYLTQVPLLRDIALGLGCIPLQQRPHKQIHFFREAEATLGQAGYVGLFPEGAERIASLSSPGEIGSFQPGFAHLALASQVDPLPIVPVAIRVRQEWQAPGIPLPVFRLFDQTEPMFQGNGGHPVVIYREVHLSIAEPIWIGQADRPKDRHRRQQKIQDLVARAEALVAGSLHPSAQSV